MSNVAIIQPFLTHYRESIYHSLCKQDSSSLRYWLYSDKESNTDVKAIDPSKADIPIEAGGLRWRFIKNLWIAKIFLWQCGVSRIARDPLFDTIIIAGSIYHLSTWYSLMIAKKHKKRILLWTHGYLKVEYGIKGWLRYRFYSRSDGLLLFGNRARDILIGRGFNPDSLYVVFNSLDYEKQRSVKERITKDALMTLKQKLFHKPEYPIILFVGRLTKEKKLHMIFEAAKILQNRGISINILIVGKGLMLDSLHKLAVSLKLNDFTRFYGPCYDESELGPLLRLSNICVSPGNIGLTCIHALTYGTPVITHSNQDDQGPEWEAIHENLNGAFFKQDDVEDLASVIAKGLEMWKDRECVQKACEAIVDQYYNPEYQRKVFNASVSGVPATKFKLI